MSERTRAHIYRVLVALFAVLTLYGVVAGDEVPALLALATAMLGLGGTGLAAKNTSTQRDG